MLFKNYNDKYAWLQTLVSIFAIHFDKELEMDLEVIERELSGYETFQQYNELGVEGPIGIIDLKNRCYFQTNVRLNDGKYKAHGRGLVFVEAYDDEGFEIDIASCDFKQGKIVNWLFSKTFRNKGLIHEKKQRFHFKHMIGNNNKCEYQYDYNYKPSNQNYKITRFYSNYLDIIRLMNNLSIQQASFHFKGIKFHQKMYVRELILENQYFFEPEIIRQQHL